MFAGKKSAQIREILISESTWEEMTCLFAPSLTQTGDSGLQIRGVNMNGQVNDAIFEKMINSLKSRYSDAWITQNARQGSMAAMQLSQSDLLYDQSYTNQCNTLINNVHREWGNK